MSKIVIFGGTTEGRKLCEACSANGVPVIYCVAGADGARQVETLSNLDIRVGRLGSAEMAALFALDTPRLVVDATHPYAEEAGKNIASACAKSAVKLLRVRRDSAEGPDCAYFNGFGELIPWLESRKGNIFVSTGSSTAGAFTKLADYRNRVWLRVLPSLESLKVCLDAGYRADRLICMQGPFSEALNRAMFQNADARILVTKDSGGPGGFPEKLRAARALGVATAVLSRPDGAGGVSLDEAIEAATGSSV